MTIAVKLDENLGRAHKELLRQAGYAAERVHDEGLSGQSDPAVWQHVCDRGLFFITLDLDFSDIRRLPRAHPGILLRRPRTNGRQAVLARVLSEQPLDALRGCLVVADERHTRIRRPS